MLRCEMSRPAEPAVVADPSASSEVFRWGRRGYRDGGRRLRVVALATPDKAYRAFVEAVSVVACGIGEAVDIVLDFSGSRPRARQAVGLQGQVRRVM